MRPNVRKFFTSSRRLEGLAGTVPLHNSYILLNTRIPPSSFPSRIPSKLQRTLQLHASRWGGLVNFAWTPGPLESESKGHHDEVLQAEWEAGIEGGEQYSALAFSTHGGTLEIPEITMANLEDVATKLKDHASPEATKRGHPPHSRSPGPDVLHLYVCTHGERDCRCGETGGAVSQALREEVERRSLSGAVKIGSVGHVGGHKYAANILVFPYGEWLGNVTPTAVPTVLDSLLALRESTSSASFLHAQTPPLCPSFWRGRMGLDKETQLQLISSRSPQDSESLDTITLQPHSSRS